VECDLKKIKISTNKDNTNATSQEDFWSKLVQKWSTTFGPVLTKRPIWSDQYGPFFVPLPLYPKDLYGQFKKKYFKKSWFIN